MTTQRQSVFWNKLAPKYSKMPVEDVPAYEDTLTAVRALIQPTDNVLEIGCGTGSTAIKLAPSAHHWTATDVSTEMVRIAQEKTGPANVEFLALHADQEIPNAPFDTICGFNILHLVPDVELTLQHLFQHLKPGGLLISKTPCLSGMSFFVRLLIPVMQFFGKAPPVLFLSQDTLLSHMRAAGFQIKQSKTFGKGKDTHFIVAEKPESY